MLNEIDADCFITVARCFFFLFLSILWRFSCLKMGNKQAFHQQTWDDIIKYIYALISSFVNCTRKKATPKTPTKSHERNVQNFSFNLFGFRPPPCVYIPKSVENKNEHTKKSLKSSEFHAKYFFHMAICCVCVFFSMHKHVILLLGIRDDWLRNCLFS